eukprot:54200-Prymnesium_polylepis.2
MVSRAGPWVKLGHAGPWMENAAAEPIRRVATARSDDPCPWAGSRLEPLRAFLTSSRWSCVDVKGTIMTAVLRSTKQYIHCAINLISRDILGYVPGLTLPPHPRRLPPREPPCAHAQSSAAPRAPLRRLPHTRRSARPRHRWGTRRRGRSRAEAPTTIHVP